MSALERAATVRFQDGTVYRIRGWTSRGTKNTREQFTFPAKIDKMTDRGWTDIHTFSSLDEVGSLRNSEQLVSAAIDILQEVYGHSDPVHVDEEKKFRVN